MKHDVRLRQRATVFTYVCTGYGAVRDQPSAVVSGCVRFSVWGATLDNARKDSAPPIPKGRYPASRHTRHSCRPPGHPVQKMSPTGRPTLFRIPWIANGSGLSIHARASLDC